MYGDVFDNRDPTKLTSTLLQPTGPPSPEHTPSPERPDASAWESRRSPAGSRAAKPTRPEPFRMVGFHTPQEPHASPSAAPAALAPTPPRPTTTSLCNAVSSAAVAVASGDTSSDAAVSGSGGGRAAHQLSQTPDKQMPSRDGGSFDLTMLMDVEPSTSERPSRLQHPVGSADSQRERAPNPVYILTTEGEVAGVRRGSGSNSVWGDAETAWTCDMAVGDVEWSPWTRRQWQRLLRVSNSPHGGVLTVKRSRLHADSLWCWAIYDVGWWIGFSFLVGSVLFVVGAFASLWLYVEHNVLLHRWLHVGCYLVGSVWFTVGSGMLLYDSLYSPLLILSDDQVMGLFSRASAKPPSLTPNDMWAAAERPPSSSSFAGLAAASVPSSPGYLEHPNPSTVSAGSTPGGWIQHNRSVSFLGRWKIRRAPGELGLDMRGQPDLNQPLLLSSRCAAVSSPTVEHYQASIGEAHLRVKLKPQWCTRRYWLDVVGAAVLFVGVNCYNVMVAAELVESYLPPDTFSQDTHFALVRGPCIAGGTCFVVAGYLLWVSTHCTLSPLLWRPGSVEYWIALTNVMGSVCFLLAGAVTQPALHGRLALTFVQTAPELFVGFFVGSVLFCVQSYLMIVEIARSSDL